MLCSLDNKKHNWCSAIFGNLIFWIDLFFDAASLIMSEDMYLTEY